MYTTISKWGNSQGIRLPKSLLDEANIYDFDDVEVIAADNSLIIRRLPKGKARNRHKTIQERFKDYEGRLEQTEIDWGEPVGEEVW